MEQPIPFTLSKPIEDLGNEFAKLTHVDQIREAIKGSKDFSEKKNDDYIVFNYKFGQADSFPDPKTAPDEHTAELWKARRECRGLIFSATDGSVLSRRFHKFFNVNELDETDAELIDLSKPHILLEKLDGVFIAPFMTRGNLRFGSKTGVGNKLANLASKFVVAKSDIPYVAFSERCISLGYTPIFEMLVSGKQLIVEYKEDAMILIAIRHNLTGNYVLYEDMQKIATDAGIPVVKAFRDESKTMAELLNKINAQEGLEGVVLRFDNGLMYKVKTLWFTQKQGGNSDLLCQEREIWSLILSQKIDDVKAKAIERALKHRIEKFTRELYEALEQSAKRIEAEVLELKSKTNGNRDEFLELIKGKPSKEQIVCMQIFDGAEPLKSVIKMVKDNCDERNKLESVRFLAGNIRFY